MTIEPLTIETLLDIVRDRGLKIVIRDGIPVVRGDREQVTDALLAALKRYRKEVIAHLENEAKRTVEVSL